MELLFELFLTISLSLIFTSLFIKLFSLSSNITDNDMFFSEKIFRHDRQYYPSVLNNSVGSQLKEGQMYVAETEETLQMDKLKCVSLKDEVIKVEECHDKGKYKVEFHKVVGVEKKVKYKDVQVEVDDSEKGDKFSLEDENDDHIEVGRGEMYAAEIQEMLLMDKFQNVSIENEVISKLEECQDEGKSKVENEVKLRDVESVDGKKGYNFSLKEQNDDHEVGEEGQMYVVKNGKILQMDKFQYVPNKNEVIKLEECHGEDKSKVEIHQIVGVEKEVKLRNVQLSDSKKGGKLSLEEENDGDEDVKEGQIHAVKIVKPLDIDIHEEVICGLQEKEQLDRKICEIEIESVEEDEIVDDWEEIGTKDFEEIIGIKEGLYDFNVSFSGLNNFDVVDGK